MNPALSPHTTGFFPSRSTSAVTSSRTDGSVTTVRTISTRFCTGAGLKKCTPTTRPGCALAVEISVTDSEEVLVARMADGATIASSSRKIPFLTSSDSTTASTTKSASARSFISVVSVIRPRISACSASVILPRLTARAVECSRCWRPRATASSLISTPLTDRPLRAKTSAMPAPMVPRPTTPMVRNSRGDSTELLVMLRIVSWATSGAHRELVHPSVTCGASVAGERLGHHDAHPVGLQPERALVVAQPLLVRREPPNLGEPETCVERAVPGDVPVGAQRHRVVPRPPGLLHRGTDQCTADPATTVLGQHGELLEVGVAVEVEDVHEPDDPTAVDGDEQEPGLEVPVEAGPGGAEQHRGRGLPEVLGEERPTGVLDRREVAQVGGSGRADGDAGRDGHGDHCRFLARETRRCALPGRLRGTPDGAPPHGHPGADDQGRRVGARALRRRLVQAAELDVAAVHAPRGRHRGRRRRVDGHEQDGRHPAHPARGGPPRLLPRPRARPGPAEGRRREAPPGAVGRAPRDPLPRAHAGPSGVPDRDRPGGPDVP